MAAKWSAIPAQEVHNSRREWFDGDGRFYASVTLMCVWEDRFKLVQDLYTSRYGTVSPVSATGYNPRVWPDPGGDSNPGAFEKPDMRRIGVTSATFRTWAEIAATLGTTEKEVLDYKTNAFVDIQYGRHFSIQESLDFDVEVVTQSYLDFKWKTNLGTWDQGFVKELEVPVATLYSAILTRDYIGLSPSPPKGGGVLTPSLPTLLETVNHVNSKEYSSTQLGVTFKKGTLLMMEPELRPSIDMQNFDPKNLFGSNGFSATVKFLHKMGGTAQGEDEDTHNLFWRPTKKYGVFHGDWDRLLVPIPGRKKDDPKDPIQEYRPFKPHPKIDSDWLIPGNLPLEVIP